MGDFVHHAILVTDYGVADSHEALVAAHAVALRLFNGVAPVTPITASLRNGYSSFAVFPDGSKEGWNLSDLGDDARDANRNDLRRHHDPIYP